MGGAGAREHSRIPTDEEEETLTDAESYNSSETGHDQPVTIPWLDLLSSSNAGEKIRQNARELTGEYCYLHDGAQQRCIPQTGKVAPATTIAAILKEIAKKPVGLKDRQQLLEFQELLKEHNNLQKAVDENPESLVPELELLEAKGPLDLQEIREIRDVLASREFRAEFSLENRFDHWVRELNQMSPMQFVQITTVLSVEAGKEKLESNLHRFIHSLSLELEWPSIRERLEHLMGNHGDHRWAQDSGREVDNNGWKRQMGQDFHLLGYDPGRTASEIYLRGGRKDKFDGIPMEKAATKRWKAQWKAAEAWLTFPPEVSSLTLMTTNFFNRLFSGDGNAVYSASFCATPAVQLLSDNTSDYELTLVLKSLVDMGHFSYGFVTPVGRAVLELAFKRAEKIRWTHAIKDFLYVFVLVFMGHTLRESSLSNGVQCPVWALYLFVFLAIVVALNFVSKLFTEMFIFVHSAAGCRSCSCRGGILTGILAAGSKHATTWNVLTVAAELFSICVSVKFIWKGHWDLDHIQDSIEHSFKFFKEYPATMSSLVLIRWTILSTSFLQVEQVGRNMVPVVIAVCQPASLFFLFFLGFMIFAAFHAYYVFPIEENVGNKAHWLDNYVFNTFLKVFRLTVLGDFDLAELEGLDDKVTAQLTKLNRTSSEITGSVDVDSSDWTDQYHRAVRYQFLILSMVITVVVMNVYIGLLGELYGQAEKRSRQLYNHYRATCAYRHMCERLALYFLPNKLGICCGETGRKNDSGLYWFIYNKKQLTDDEDGEADNKSD
eukprot:s3029_g3.t1